MFADFIKMATKVAVVALVTVTVFGILGTVVIPIPDYSAFTQAVGNLKALVAYWVPGYTIILNFFAAMLTLQVTIVVVRVALMPYRWLLEINE